MDELASGKTIPESLEAAASARYDALEARDFLNQAQAAIALDVNAAAEKFRITCHTPEAFPLTLWFLLRYSDKPLDALVANTIAGGDNAARGLLIGLIMGAAHGNYWMPPHWVERLNAQAEIESLIQ